MLNNVAIMDFGSEKIKVMIGARGVNNTIIVHGIGEEAYAGFGKGNFYEPQALLEVMQKAINTAQDSAGIEVDKLFIGVPGEFSMCETREGCYTLDRKRKITSRDVNDLFLQNAEGLENDGYSIINMQPIYYTVDNDRRLVQPIGIKTSKLNGLLSYILADNRFIQIVSSLLNQLGIDDIEYISSPLAASLFVLPSEVRDSGAIIIDIGYLTSTVTIVKGDGILDFKSFSLGGGYITGDLATCLGIPFSLAETLKRKAILSIIPSETDVYEVTTKEGIKSFSAKNVNDIIIERIKIFGRTIEKCVSMCEFEIPKFMPYYLTGGGISYMRGAREYLADQLDKKIDLIAPRLPQAAKPVNSSSYGVMDMALGSENTQKKGFFAKLFGKQ